jgi:hypothetical protein
VTFPHAGPAKSSVLAGAGRSHAVPWRWIATAIAVLVIIETAFFAWGFTHPTPEGEGRGGPWLGLILFVSWPLLMLSLAAIAEVAGWRSFRRRRRVR